MIRFFNLRAIHNVSKLSGFIGKAVLFNPFNNPYFGMEMGRRVTHNLLLGILSKPTPSADPELSILTRVNSKQPPRILSDKVLAKHLLAMEVAQPEDIQIATQMIRDGDARLQGHTNKEATAALEDLEQQILASNTL